MFKGGSISGPAGGTAPVLTAKGVAGQHAVFVLPDHRAEGMVAYLSRSSMGPHWHDMGQP